MMMTSGAGVHYKSMFDAGSQIVAKEGMKSLFKGAGANILRGVAGAGVLSLYDKLQEVMFGKVYSGGMCGSPVVAVAMLIVLYQALAKRIRCCGPYTLYQPHSTIVYLACATSFPNRPRFYISAYIWEHYHRSIRSSLGIERFLIPCLVKAPDRVPSRVRRD